MPGLVSHFAKLYDRKPYSVFNGKGRGEKKKKKSYLAKKGSEHL